MPDREKVIKGVHDARRYLEDREWVDKSVGVHIDALNDALALLKEQKSQKFLVDESGKITPLPVIVRCKDCERCYFASNRVPDERSYACEKHGIDVTPDWFCADGKRRTDDA